jgi:Na+/H+ antiporter NhaD/arsenite permease-like protein
LLPIGFEWIQGYLAIGIFGLVFLLIAGRSKFGIPAWAAMLIGAGLMIGLQVISVESAFLSINLEVIAFLFGMFSIVSGLERAGVLRLFAIKMLSVAKSPSQILFILVVGMGLLSAFLVNDTIALMGVPIVAYLAKHIGIRPSVLMIALANGVTMGSVMTPIGNPQNLLIAVHSGIPTPFVTFLVNLAIPTAVSLVLTYSILRIYYRNDLKIAFKLNLAELSREVDGFYNPRLAKICSVILIATIAGFVISELLAILNIVHFSIGAIALLGASCMYAFNRQRREILKSLDYPIIVFFVAMFVVTSALWSSGALSILFFDSLPAPNPNDALQSSAVITAASIGMSQVLSNVPFVALYNFVLTDNGFQAHHVDQWMMLAAASTVAGSLTILGAASNIIIIEASESRGIKAFSFYEFFKVGAIVTLVTLPVYFLFIVLI